MRAAPSDWAHSLSWGLMLLSLVLMFALSANALAALGVPYDRPGGPMPVKLHPSTYTLTAAALLALAGRGNPVGVAIEVARRLPLLMVYLTCMVIVALWSVWLHGSAGAAFFVDSLWMPALALVALVLQPRHRHRRLLHWIVAGLVLNALLALWEYGAGSALIPQTVGLDNLQPDDYFRASALLGHPLTNALVTASLLPAALLMPLGHIARLVLLAVLAMALLAYGGRAALAVCLMCYGLGAVGALARRALREGFSYRQWTGGLLLGVLGSSLVVGVVVVTGLGERIFANLAWDNSANVRLVVWDALAQLDPVEWWVGVSAARLDAIKLAIGLDPLYEAIENYWVGILLQVGLMGFLPFLFGLACGVAAAWRRASPGLRLGIMVFFIAGSGANTLSSKTVAMTLLFMASHCAAAFRPLPTPPARRPLPAGPAGAW